MEFYDLPDEKILEICENLDDISLARFVQTSERNKAICNQVIIERNKLYNEYVDSLISDLQNNKFEKIKLNTTDKNREFLLYYAEEGLFFIVELLSSSSSFVLSELGYTSKSMAVGANIE